MDDFILFLNNRKDLIFFFFFFFFFQYFKEEELLTLWQMGLFTKIQWNNKVEYQVGNAKLDIGDLVSKTYLGD